MQGVNYVFDKRMGDKVTGDMLSKCHQCGQPCADHTNCANSCCHARLIQCQRWDIAAVTTAVAAVVLFCLPYDGSTSCVCSSVVS